MKVPTVREAEIILEDARLKNPGEWVEHCKQAAIAARTIAYYCDDLNSDDAYVLGLLHDIGRRYGSMDLRHIICGYKYLNELGYIDAAEICMSHAFPIKEIDSYNGYNDCTEDETNFIRGWLEMKEYEDYDKLIQFCDAISYPDGPAYLEKRFVSVVMKKGFNEHTIEKWKKLYAIKDYFEKKTNADLYQLLYVK